MSTNKNKYVYSLWQLLKLKCFNKLLRWIYTHVAVASYLKDMRAPSKSLADVFVLSFLRKFILVSRYT